MVRDVAKTHLSLVDWPIWGAILRSQMMTFMFYELLRMKSTTFYGDLFPVTMDKI